MYTMKKKRISVSTRQASELLGVHESSIKRWCNAEELDCWLTPGGHRRIPIVALVDFAQSQGVELSLRHFGREAGRVWDGLERARGEDDFGVLYELAYTWIAEGSSDLTAGLIEYLSREGIPLGRILDRVVGPVMRHVGEGYQYGDLSIGDEHRMTQAMRDVLVILSAAEDPTVRQNGKVSPVAVVGCVRGEVHELGALMVRLVLKAEGWRVIYLGLNVPTEEFAAQQAKHGATLVCISMMPPIGMAEAQTTIRLLDRMYLPARPYRLALGGSALGKIDELDHTDILIPEVQLFSKLEPFMGWVRTLTA